jgi:hypothetical protein
VLTGKLSRLRSLFSKSSKGRESKQQEDTSSVHGSGISRDESDDGISMDTKPAVSDAAHSRKDSARTPFSGTDADLQEYVATSKVALHFSASGCMLCLFVFYVCVYVCVCVHLRLHQLHGRAFIDM